MSLNIVKGPSEAFNASSTFSGLSITPTFNGTPPDTATIESFRFTGSGGFLSFAFGFEYTNPGVGNTSCILDFPYDENDILLPSLAGVFSDGYILNGLVLVWDDTTTKPVEGIMYLKKIDGVFTIECDFPSTNVKRISGRMIYGR